MPKEASSINKGVALLLVLMVILIAVIIANISLTFILSQSRLTHHEISRIQAYYACQAGINYALEMLRLGAAAGGWTAGTHCTAASPCNVQFDANDFNPASIVNNRVSIVIRPAGSSGCMNSPGNTACVSATANYTYTP